LTPDYGKLRLMARGVRKARSKLAGGIELFSVSEVSFIQGRGEIGTLTSTRLLKHYGRIVKALDRVQLGYGLIKQLNRATEDHPEPEYFELLEQAFQALDDAAVSLDLIRLWFEARLLQQAGYTPNLRTDTDDQKLQSDQTYNFDFEAMAFAPHTDGSFTAGHIKTLRLLFSGHPPGALQKVQGTSKLLPTVMPLIRTMLTSYIRV
jgi:DNA repair protein RecO (recombination protein O)